MAESNGSGNEQLYFIGFRSNLGHDSDIDSNSEEDNDYVSSYSDSLYTAYSHYNDTSSDYSCDCHNDDGGAAYDYHDFENCGYDSWYQAYIDYLILWYYLSGGNLLEL